MLVCKIKIVKERVSPDENMSFKTFEIFKRNSSTSREKGLSIECSSLASVLVVKTLAARPNQKRSARNGHEGIVCIRKKEDVTVNKKVNHLQYPWFPWNATLLLFSTCISNCGFDWICCIRLRLHQ